MVVLTSIACIGGMQLANMIWYYGSHQDSVENCYLSDIHSYPEGCVSGCRCTAIVHDIATTAHYDELNWVGNCTKYPLEFMCCLDYKDNLYPVNNASECVYNRGNYWTANYSGNVVSLVAFGLALCVVTLACCCKCEKTPSYEEQADLLYQAQIEGANYQAHYQAHYQAQQQSPPQDREGEPSVYAELPYPIDG